LATTHHTDEISSTCASIDLERVLSGKSVRSLRPILVQIFLRTVSLTVEVISIDSIYH
jgi:hypothetical protein